MIRLFAALCTLSIVISFPLNGFTADPLVSKSQKEAKAVAPAPDTLEWRSDPVNQMVFFAVLEGLYTDGVPNEVVDLIVSSKDDKESNVKHSFVFRCSLCHAAYEAFALYQKRPNFVATKGKANTFGTGVDPKILRDLKSDQPSVRVMAMGKMMRPWIDRRIKMMRLSPEEKTEMLVKMAQYASEGTAIFRKIKKTDSAYFDWQFYGGCQACEAINVIAKEHSRNQK